VARINRALENAEQIAIYGDYDVDGLAATALLVHFLSNVAGKISWYLPHRVREGYGLNSNAIRYLRDQGIGLVITTDCGSSDHEAIQCAREIGVDVIVTDHHQPPSSLPQANALVNPKLRAENQQHHDLAGVGVALYLAIALRAHFRGSGRWSTSDQPNLKDYLDLVALGTLADMAPLTSTNRILSRAGLLVLSRTSRPGLRALMEICRIEAAQVTDLDVLFRLAPRLNASGRLGNAGQALRLLLTTDLSEARVLARELDLLNKQRQGEEEQLLTEAHALIETNKALRDSRSLILASPHWHKGLLGLVASRLVERFNKPTILLTRSDSGWEGSGRSIDFFDLYEALRRCKEHLVRFGGHQLAVGLGVKDTKLAEFRAAFEKIAEEKLSHPGTQRVIKVDKMVRLEEITPEFVTYLEQMRPFGENNPEPIFCCQDFHIENSQPLKGRHLRLMLHQGSARLNAIGFNILESNQVLRPPERLLFSPRWNHWQGEKRLQLHIVDYC
jgi:single-stranded-DNA-specific exonuclease